MKNTLQIALFSLFERDIDRLLNEINSFENDEQFWIKQDGISNTAGNLVLHLCGNLNHFIGSQLGNSSYVRNRDLEFSTEFVPKDELIETVQTMKATVLETIQSLSDDHLESIYPLQPLGFEMKTTFFLIHLNGHLNYHLGQINYFRRMLRQ